MFKKGDFISVKPNTQLESGEIVNNWAGEIQEVYTKEKCCLVTFDAQTIDSLEDSYLKASIEEGSEPFEYVFAFKDIEIALRRDTDEQIMTALNKLSSRMIALEEEDVNSYEEEKKEWVEEFEKSSFYETLNNIQKENANFVAGTFMDFMYNYEYVKPSEWSPSSVISVCIEIVPRKITSEIELFENYGDILISFLSYLGSEKHVKNSEELVKAVEKIKTRIPLEANNPNNWGMAKSMMMSAQSEGFDISNQEDIEKFLMLKQMEALKELEEGKAKIIPLREDPFKGIGRNQKITVKYNDGRILEEIKFKKVESDLRNGLCDIMKK